MPMLRVDGMGFGRDIGDQVRRALESAKVGINNGFDSFGRGFNRSGGRIDW
jgi:hypothetical protein